MRIGTRKREEEEEGQEEEEGLYLRIETRKRVQTNEAKSKRRDGGREVALQSVFLFVCVLSVVFAFQRGD